MVRLLNPKTGRYEEVDDYHYFDVAGHFPGQKMQKQKSTHRRRPSIHARMVRVGKGRRFKRKVVVNPHIKHIYKTKHKFKLFGHMRQLPIVKIGKKKYFVDARLNELRNINNPGDSEKMEGSEEFYVKNFSSIPLLETRRMIAKKGSPYHQDQFDIKHTRELKRLSEKGLFTEDPKIKESRKEGGFFRFPTDEEGAKAASRQFPKTNLAVHLKDDPYIKGYIYKKMDKNKFVLDTTEGNNLIFTKKELKKEWEKD